MSVITDEGEREGGQTDRQARDDDDADDDVIVSLPFSDRKGSRSPGSVTKVSFLCSIMTQFGVSCSTPELDFFSHMNNQ